MKLVNMTLLFGIIVVLNFAKEVGSEHGWHSYYNRGGKCVKAWCNKKDIYALKNISWIIL